MEVLLLTDRIDEWVAGHLHEFEGKPLANVASAAADVASAIETPGQGRRRIRLQGHPGASRQDADSARSRARRCRARLTESPAVLVAGEFGMSLRMGRILKQAGQSNPFATLPILELNPKHPLVERLKGHRGRGGVRGSGACAVRPGDAGGGRRAGRSGDLRSARQQAHRRGALAAQPKIILS